MGVRHATDDAHTRLPKKRKKMGSHTATIFIEYFYLPGLGKRRGGRETKVTFGFSAVAVASVTAIVASVLLDLSMPGISGQKRNMTRHTTFPHSFEKEKSNKPLGSVSFHNNTNWIDLISSLTAQFLFTLVENNGLSKKKKKEKREERKLDPDDFAVFPEWKEMGGWSFCFSPTFFD